MLGRVDLVAREVEALEQVQRQQRGEALRGRRRLVHRVAAIGGRDRLAPLALVRGQILRGEKALAGHAVRDRARHAPLVEELGLAAQLGQRACKVGLAKAVAGLRELAAGHEDAVPFRIVRGGRLLADGLRDDVGERESLARVVDRRLEQRRQRARAEAIEQHAPAARHAGHGHRAGAHSRHRGEAASPELVERGARARPARAAQEVHALRGRLAVEAEDVAAHAAEVGLGDREHGVGGDGGVHHVAARLQHVHARQRGEGVARGHHAAVAHGRLAMRVTDLRHPSPPRRCG